MINKLKDLVKQYALNKSELDSYDKLCKKENAEIKSLMETIGVSEVETDEYVAKRIIQKRENMNEEKLLKIAHHYGIPEVVKTKEYIDYDALEDAIYNGKLSKEILEEINTARETKEVITLKVSRRKEKKWYG